jgi:NAD(P)H-nitrite reductase large subunit
LEGLTVSGVDEKGFPIPDSEYKIACDTLILSVGLIPENEIIRQLNIAVQPETDAVMVNQHLETSLPGIFLCGNSLHVNDLVDNVSTEGETAGTWAAVHVLGHK